MKAPKKVIAAMAMATLLGGTAAPAFADNHFKAAGEDVNGISIQTSNLNSKDDTTTLETDGKITVNGNFIKTVSALPVPVEEGRYLRVTMPIKADFTYDVDDDSLQSPDIKIVNESVNVMQGDQREYKDVEMSLVGLTENSGIGVDNTKFEFVDEVNKASSNGKVQLPFEVNVVGKDLEAGTYSFKKLGDLREGQGLTPITIKAQDSVTLKIGKINDQKIWNKEKITNDITKTSHGLKMKFEYKN